MTTDEEEASVTIWTDNEFSYFEWTEARVHVPMEAGQTYYVIQAAIHIDRDRNNETDVFLDSPRRA